MNFELKFPSFDQYLSLLRSFDRYLSQLKIIQFIFFLFLIKIIYHVPNNEKYDMKWKTFYMKNNFSKKNIFHPTKRCLCLLNST